jgi:hypothetical protein
MAIRTRLRSAFWIRKLALAAFFLVFALIAGRAGWITYPAQRDRYFAYMEYTDLNRYHAAEMTPGEHSRLAELKRDLGEMSAPPGPRTHSDVLLQQLLAGVGAALAIAFGLSWWQASRWSCELRDDGTLIAPEGTFPPGKMKKIDATQWAGRKLARLEVIVKSDDPRDHAIRLDGWSHDGVAEIVDAIHARLHPPLPPAPPSVVESTDTSEAGPAFHRDIIDDALAT